MHCLHYISHQLQSACLNNLFNFVIIAGVYFYTIWQIERYWISLSSVMNYVLNIGFFSLFRRVLKSMSNRCSLLLPSQINQKTVFLTAFVYNIKANCKWDHLSFTSVRIVHHTFVVYSCSSFSLISNIWRRCLLCVQECIYLPLKLQYFHLQFNRQHYEFCHKSF